MIRLWRARFAVSQQRGRVVADLRPIQPAEGISLSRWSRLKRAAAEVDAANTARAEPVEASPLVAKDDDCLSPNGKLHSVSASSEYAELPPISAISLAEDFTPFMQAKVPQALKQRALKALFKEPHFNVMDGLDIYIDDYTVFEPISPEVMATLSSWKTIMNPSQQVVTPGGYAVDAESEEGKAVLAARAELDDASAALQASAGGVEVPAPAARAQSAEPTSQTINPDAVDETLQLNDDANVAAPTPIPTPTPTPTTTPTSAQACSLVRERSAGEGAAPHVRYGKRVGDFSALAYETADDAARKSSTSELDETATAAPKSMTQ